VKADGQRHSNRGRQETSLRVTAIRPKADIELN
jgi:hypothetical protein